MLLTDLKKVRELDSKIGDMHSRLAELYKQRSILMSEQGVLTESSGETFTPLHKQWYHRVAKEWESYGLVLPAYAKVKSKFIKAEKILRTISETYPEIAADMEVVAIPPSKEVALPVVMAQRNVKKLVDLADYVNKDMKLPKAEKEWQILLAYTAQTSLYAGSAKKILEDKSYMLAGYDARELGLREYGAMTLQKNELLDTDSWTVFLKDMPKKDVAAYAGYRNGRYRFDLEESDNVLDDDGFRPAIKV